ncbi:MAG: DNA polymerase III subunit delta' [Candidatus Solibacter sp.]|nr:DNA polymerase III subunit delta' [Candidatus Solibacter sp.]
MFEGFHGNQAAQETLERMIASHRIPQTLLISGPEGVGKATLARRFAQRLLDHPERIDADDLSLEANRTVISEREKWTSEKRSEEPLLFSTHPDFTTFCPEGPLRQISIQQMRLLRERAQRLPLKGKWKVFLIDQIDRTSQQSSDSLLKTLEEPPPHLILFATAENAYDLPPTIRSRSVQISMSPLPDSEVRAFLNFRHASDIGKRVAYAAGSPGLALSLDLDVYEKRRAAMLALLEAASGAAHFAAWVKASESLLASKSEKLDLYFRPLYGLLEDLLGLHSGSESLRNRDLLDRLSAVAARISFDWLRQAVELTDELVTLQRRNVQKGPSLDNLVLKLRGSLARATTEPAQAPRATSRPV